MCPQCTFITTGIFSLVAFVQLFSTVRFSNVSSNCLPLRMQSHTGCICLTSYQFSSLSQELLYWHSWPSQSVSELRRALLKMLAHLRSKSEIQCGWHKPFTTLEPSFLQVYPILWAISFHCFDYFHTMHWSVLPCNAARQRSKDVLIDQGTFGNLVVVRMTWFNWVKQGTLKWYL